MRDGFSSFGGSLVTAAAEGPYHAAAVGDLGTLYVLTKDYTTIEVWPEGFDGSVAREPVQKLNLWGNTLAWVRCMTYHGGYLFLTDCGQFGVMRIDTRTGHVARIAGREAGGCRDGVANLAEFYHPWGVCVDERDGAIYVADNYNSRIRRIRKISSLGNDGDVDHSMPATAAASESGGDAAGSHRESDDLSPLFVVDTIAGTGKQRATNGVGREAAFNLPLGIYVTPARQLYISEQNSIRRVDLASAEFNVTTEVESLSSHDRARFLKKMTQRCARLRRDPSSLISPAHPYNPHGVAVAADGSLFINDYGNHRVVQVLPAVSSPLLAPTPRAVSALACASLTPTTTTGSLTPALSLSAANTNSALLPHSPQQHHCVVAAPAAAPPLFVRAGPAPVVEASSTAPSSSVEDRARLVAGSGRLELRDGYGRGASIRDPSSMSFDRCHSTLYFIDAGVLRVLEVQLDEHSFMPKVFNALGQYSPLPFPMRHLVIGYLVEDYKFIEGVSHER